MSGSGTKDLALIITPGVGLHQNKDRKELSQECGVNILVGVTGKG